MNYSNAWNNKNNSNDDVLKKSPHSPLLSLKKKQNPEFSGSTAGQTFSWDRFFLGNPVQYTGWLPKANPDGEKSLRGKLFDIDTAGGSLLVISRADFSICRGYN